MTDNNMSRREVLKAAGLGALSLTISGLSLAGEEKPEPNAKKRNVLFIAIDRRITQGTRGIKGREWCEKIWTVMATCAQQGRSAFKYIHDAVHAYFTRTEAPSLLTIS